MSAMPPSPPPSPPAKPASSRPQVVPKPQALTCPNCGAAMTLRTFANAVNVVCSSCGSVLDATDPKLTILQEAAKKQHIRPLIPLGTRGKWQGSLYEVVGVQRRAITADEAEYAWFEYVLFNPYAGYRYLTDYEGHWNDVVMSTALPKQPGLGNYSATKIKDQFVDPSAKVPQRKIVLGDHVYTQFQSARAKTTDVIGEFPWQVRVGDQVMAKDFVSPPYMLSSEETDQETTWSVGTYVTGKDIWQAFKLPGSPPDAKGIYANQPSPFGESPGQFWRTATLLLASALTLLVLIFMISGNKQVFTGSYTFQPRGGKQETSFVTPAFEVAGRTSNVEIETNTDLSNGWVYFNFALINEETGKAYDFGREVSYYWGFDGEENWSEGGRKDNATIPAVPPGHYYLLVEPEKGVTSRPVSYTIRVKRDVPSVSFFFIAALLLLIPPAIMSARSWSFEYQRWQESDYSKGES